MEAKADDFVARDIYMSDGPCSRRLDLWPEASRRYDVEELYEIAAFREGIRPEYEELVAKYGSVDPLCQHFT